VRRSSRRVRSVSSVEICARIELTAGLLSSDGTRRAAAPSRPGLDLRHELAQRAPLGVDRRELLLDDLDGFEAGLPRLLGVEHARTLLLPRKASSARASSRATLSAARAGTRSAAD
jgi:hypothetical protein